MAIAPITDPVLAASLLASALGGRPELTPDQLAQLLALASTTDSETEVVSWERRGMNRAAAIGWNWKSALLADQYDLAGGGGTSLTRSQWFDHCAKMGRAYGSGSMDVLEGSGGAIGAFGITSSTSVAYPRLGLVINE